MITLGWLKRRRFALRLTDLRVRAGLYRLATTDGAHGSPVAAEITSVAVGRQVRSDREARNYFMLSRTKSVDNEPLHLESQHSFYHARTATCSVRAYKQRADYPSIPDRGGSPRSFLAPYDHSTSSGSSTGDPESATSD